MKKLNQKTILITGGARGIGFCTAEYFAGVGAKVIIVDINSKELLKAKKKLKEIHKDIYSYVMDVTNEKQVKDVMQKVINKFGHLDVLINNAGIGYTNELIKTDLKTWKKLIDVNLMGVLYTTYAILPKMIKKETGHIVNVSSGQAFFRLPTWGAYAAIKLAMACFSEVLHYEVKKYGIQVSTVYPFMVDTNFYENADPDTFAGQLSMRLVPYYSMKPQTVGKMIFEVVKEGKKVERVSFLNDIAFYGRVVPYFSDTISKITNYILAGSKKHEHTNT